MTVTGFTVVWCSAWLAIAVLSGTLAFRLWLRRLPALKDETMEIPPGRGFDTSPVTTCLREVRRDYLTSLHARPHPRIHAAALVATAREHIRQSSYFQDAELDPR